MRVVPSEDGAGLNLRGHTLVMPGGGTLGNLGELCVDALVSTFGLHRVAIVQSRHIVPLIMSSAWETGTSSASASQLTTAAEIYQGAAAPGISVLQLRSAVVEGRRLALAQELMAWARSAGAAELLVLSSCSSHIKLDADLAAHTDLRYVQVGRRGAETPELGLDVLPLGHSTPQEDFGDAGAAAGVQAARRLLRSGGLARPLVLLAGEAVDAEAQPSDAAGGFSPPPRTGGAPGVLCLLGLTGEVVDWRLVEQLTALACKSVAGRLGTSAPTLRPPPSWRLQFEATVPEQRLWG